jgi:hypothetical protein
MWSNTTLSASAKEISLKLLPEMFLLFKTKLHSFIVFVYTLKIWYRGAASSLLYYLKSLCYSTPRAWNLLISPESHFYHPSTHTFFRVINLIDNQSIMHQ